jgi:hypothetical protein
LEKYIGVKMIEAEPAKLEREQAGGYLKGADGYKVRYPDGYESWSPKEVFEKAYMKVVTNPELKSGCSVSQEMVDDFIKEINVTKQGDKMTCVRVVLANGFEILEASACVDPANYDEEMGKKICMERIESRVWFLLGFLLQTAVNGIK